MADSKFLEYQDKDNSGLLDKCDDLANVPAEKICPPCRKNSTYMAPDWKTKTVDEPWLNERLCEYQVTVVTDYTTSTPSTDASDSEAEEYINSIFVEHQEEAIEGVLEYYEKEISDANIDSLKNSVKFDKYDLNIRPSSRLKLLYSIPYENIASIEDALDDDIDEDKDSDSDDNTSATSVTYVADDFVFDLLKVRKALHLYSTYLKVFRGAKKGNLIFSNDNRIFYLGRYGDNGFTGSSVLEKIIKDIEQFLNRKGYRIRGVDTTRGKGRDVVATLSLGFSGEYRLNKITITTQSCGEKEFVFGKKKIKSLRNKGHFKDKTAMAYLSRINEMIVDLEAREPLPWTEFVIKYTYPPVVEKFNWPDTSLTSENTTKSCIGEALAAEGKQLGQDILDDDFNLQDSLLYLFNKQSCKSDLQGVRREDVELNLLLERGKAPLNKDKIFDLARQQAFQQLQMEGDIFLSSCFKIFSGNDSDGNSPPQSTREAFNRFFDRIKVCGMKDFTLDAIKCLLAGLTLEQALGSIVKSAMQNMSMENFGQFFAGLPGDVQAKVQENISNKLSSGDLFKQNSTNQQINDYIENGLDPGQITNIEPWTMDSTYRFMGYKQPGFEDNLGDTNVNVNRGTLAQRYMQTTNKLSATDNFLLQLYMDEILEVLGDQMFTAVDVLNRFPGSQLVIKTLFLFDCPQPPLFSPSMLDFINDIEIPFCNRIDDITLPEIRNPLNWLPKRKDIAGNFTAAINLALQQALVSVLSRLMVKVCNLIGSSRCKAIETTGALATNYLTPGPSDSLASIISKAICGSDADSDQIQDTIADMFEKLGLGATAMADKEKTMNFAEDISSSLTRSEMLGLFLGKPTPEGCAVVSALIKNEYPEYESALPSDQAVCDFFNGMGNLLPADTRSSMGDFLDSLGEEDELPANPTLCATPEDLNRFCEFRTNLLAGRSTKLQAELMCQNEQDDLLSQLDDLTNALQQGPQEMLNNAIPPLMSDPGCDNGILPFEPEAVNYVANQSLNLTMKQIHLDFSTDMLGNGPGERNWGLMNMILSDTLGNPLTAHYRKAFNDNSYVNFVVDGDTNSKGQFPAYVAEWMQEQLGSLNTSVETNNNFREEKTITRTFEQLNLSLYGGVSTVDLPDFGYNTYAVVKTEEQQVEFIKQGRKKDPDLQLEFRDNNKGLAEQGDSFLYGFNLNLFISELTENNSFVTNIANDNARINITNLLNFNAKILRADRKTMSKEQRDALAESDSKTASVQKERVYEFASVDDTFDFSRLTQFPEFQNSFTIEQEYAPQVILLNEILTQQGYTGSIQQVKEFHDQTMSSIFASLATEVSGNQKAFKYGAQYDSLTDIDVKYVVNTGQTDSAAGTFYSDALINGEPITNDDGVLGISYDQYVNGENARVFFLDPAQFGGSYVNPPVYIKPMKNEGWLGLVDVMFPDLSPCKPTKTDLIDFSDISEQVSNTYNNIPMDERLKQDPDCIVELPYNRILERMSTANMQGLITAACRIFSSVHFIKTMATFTTFKPDFDNVYSSLYPQYIVENMESAFKDAQSAAWEAINPFKDEDFWYAFLEQSVQTYGRLVDQGTIIDPPQSVLQALFRINNMQSNYEFPTKADWISSFEMTGDTKKALALSALRPIKAIKALTANIETYKEYKERLNLEAVKATEEDAKLILKEMVKSELKIMSEKFLENLKEFNMEPTYTDIDYYILTNFTQGGIDLDLDKEIIEVEETSPSGPSYGDTSNALNHVHTYEVDADGNGWAYEAYSPLDERIHHKHKITNWVVEVAQSSCYPNCKDLYGFEGLSGHNHYISNMIVPIGDIQPLGYAFDTTTDDARPFLIEKYVSINGVKYSPEEATEIIKSNPPTLNISDVYPGTLEQVTDPSGKVVGLTGELGVRHGLQFSAIIAGQKYEIATVEIDALDYEIQRFQPVAANSKELLCLLKLLKEEERFRLITRYVMPTNKFLSVLAIYNDMAFLPSIGEKTVADGDYFEAGYDAPGVQVAFDDTGAPIYTYVAGWASAEDRNPGLLSGLTVREWDSWDQELLRNSKSRIKSIFKNLYSARDFKENIDSMLKFDPVEFQISSFKNKLKPKTGETLFPRWRRKNLRNNPFDAKGTLCKK
tara:strand:- start:6169 stop:12507 length:6339 start_codon:yes stop_codon:yes gene_type:complete